VPRKGDEGTQITSHEPSFAPGARKILRLDVARHDTPSPSCINAHTDSATQLIVVNFKGLAVSGRRNLATGGEALATGSDPTPRRPPTAGHKEQAWQR
jgi:hypothetical protein